MSDCAKIKLCFQNETARRIYDEGVGPARGTSGSAGFDLRACLEEEEIIVEPGARIKCPSGIAVEPSRQDLAGFVYSRSGLGAVQGLTVAQGVGLIDPDYRGEIVVFLLNTSGERRVVKRGDRVAQLVFQRVEPVVIEIAEELGHTGRGEGGFGHTGAS